jgi:hypothetical protein
LRVQCDGSLAFLVNAEEMGNARVSSGRQTRSIPWTRRRYTRLLDLAHDGP